MEKKRRSSEPSENNFWHDLEVESRNYLKYYSNEPLVEVRDKGNEVEILLEANGSRSNDISIEKLNPSSITVLLTYRGRRIRRKVDLPSKIKVKSHTIKVKNGVARIRLLISR